MLLQSTITTKPHGITPAITPSTCKQNPICPNPPFAHLFKTHHLLYSQQHHKTTMATNHKSPSQQPFKSVHTIFNFTTNPASQPNPALMDSSPVPEPPQSRISILPSIPSPPQSSSAASLNPRPRLAVPTAACPPCPAPRRLPFAAARKRSRTEEERKQQRRKKRKR